MQTTDITQFKDERPLLMKSGLVHWIKPQTAEKIQSVLSQQTSHTFIRISELNITITTAEVEGVYTMEQYEDLTRIKQGMFQCAYRKWHGKKEECQCKRELLQKQREREKQEQDERDNRPLTPEEQAASRERFTKMNEIAALEKPGSVMSQMYHKHNTRGKFIRRSTVEEWEKKTGLKASPDLAIEPLAIKK